MLKFHLEVVKNSIDMIEYFKEKYKNFYGLPLRVDIYDEVVNSYEEKANFDSITSRFQKIQSILGEKIFREILEEMNISTKGRNMIEILSLLRKNGIVDFEAKEWLELREIRNSLSHDYPDDLDEIVDTINEVFEKVEFLKNIYNSIKNSYDEILKFKG
jgi:glycerophosphoryl diester phosphodiesterase